MITPSQKVSIWCAGMSWFQKNYGDKLAQQGACLYLNQAAMRELHLRGHRVILQAGDMHWQMIRPEMDDGIQATHFGYEFDLSQPFSQDALARGLFPECHVWAALPDENCIVDFSTGYLPHVAETQHGYTWTAQPPPPFVFGVPPVQAVYIPKMEAIRFVWRFIAEKLVDEEQRDQMLQRLEATAA